MNKNRKNRSEGRKGQSRGINGHAKGQLETLAEQAQYNINELAKLCRVSRRQLLRVIRRRLKRTPESWLNERRIIASRRLLLSGVPVKVVALELGYKQTSHFCRQFKSLNQMTPTAFASARDAGSLKKAGTAEPAVTAIAPTAR